MKFIKSLIAPTVVCFCMGTVLTIGINQNQSNNEIGFKEGKQKTQESRLKLPLRNNLKYPTIN